MKKSKIRKNREEIKTTQIWKYGKDTIWDVVNLGHRWNKNNTKVNNEALTGFSKFNRKGFVIFVTVGCFRVGC